MPFLLDPTDPVSLTQYLRSRGLVGQSETIATVSKAGDGNMNCTIRVATTGQKLIVKQGRPWVEKYPHIPAPQDRSLVEAAFYTVVAQSPIGAMMPRLLDVDVENRVLALEDLGDRGDLTTLYAGETLDDQACAALMRYLQLLYRLRVPADRRPLLANREMRALNHEHMFLFPLRDANGLALDAVTPGLQAAADALKTDRLYVERVHAIGERYLADGDVLVHGDYFPGSWLRVDGGVAVIDPEFCFVGCGELDAGVMIAHMRLAGQPSSIVERLQRELPAEYDRALVRRFTGVEIMRRLIGVAQLPLKASIDRKRAWLDESRALVLGE